LFDVSLNDVHMRTSFVDSLFKIVAAQTKENYAELLAVLLRQELRRTLGETEAMKFQVNYLNLKADDTQAGNASLSLNKALGHYISAGYTDESWTTEARFLKTYLDCNSFLLST
jgi:hypothetical protein